MLWAALAIISGILFGLIGVVGKRLMQETSSVTYTTIYTLLAATFYLPFFLYFLSTSGIQITSIVLIAFFISGLANITGFLAYNQSIHAGKLSEEVPLSKLNPLFTAIIAVPLLGETLSTLNITGILLVIAGTFTVLVNPFKLVSSLKEKDSLRPAGIAVLSAIIFSVAAVADRFATQIVDPTVYTMMIFTFMVAGYMPLMNKREEKPYTEIKAQLFKHPFLYTLTGFMAIGASLAIFTSFSLAEASRVIPLLQLQVLISVMAGGKLFKEEDIIRKLLGSLIMIGGIILVLA